MTLLRYFGFDDSAPAAGMSTLAMNAGTTPGRTGGGCIINQSNNAYNWAYLTPNPLPAGATFYAGLGYKCNAFTVGSHPVIEFRESATTHIRIAINVDIMNSFSILRNNTVLATGAAVNVPSTWTFIEVAVNIGANGSVVMRVDGHPYLTFNGNTQNGGTGIIDRVGAYEPNINTGSLLYSYDDLYLCDALGGAPFNNFLGDVCVKQLLPNGNGDVSGMVNEAGNSTNNYTHVDFVNSQSAKYVGTSSAGVADRYTITPLSATDTPLAIKNQMYAAKSDAGAPPNLTTQAKGAAGTVRVDSAPVLSTSYVLWEGSIYTTDPDGNPLTSAGVNAMEIGVST